MFPRFDTSQELVIDTETTGLSFWKDRVFGISIANSALDTWYWDLRTQPRVVEWLCDLVKTGVIKKWVGHNTRFDVHMLRESGVELPLDRIDCTMVRAALLNEHEPTYSLDFLARKYCGVKKDDEIYAEMAKLFGGRGTRNAQMPNISRAPEAIVGRYAKQDALATMMLYQHQEKTIGEVAQVHRLELDLMPVLIDMERWGIRVDVDRAEKAIRDISKRAEDMQRYLNSLAGFEVNPNPSGSIAKLFEPKQREDGVWILNDGTRAESTEGGKASINADCLRRMKHPAAKIILDLRKLLKTRDTFLAGHILGHHHEGIVHPNYNQTKNDAGAGTGTGRLSVNSPALQQIPARDKEIASVVRPIFLPDEGRQEWLSIDWSQMEQRIFAHYVNSPEVIARYQQDPKTDFYQVMADLTGLPRSPSYAGEPNAKQMTLASIFGMGSGLLAQEMGLPYTVDRVEINGAVREYLKAGPEALAVMDKFYKGVPGIKSYLNQASSVAKSRGYVTTKMGRRLRFPGGQFTHKAGGLILQGTAADAMKLKLIETFKLVQGHDARLLLTVHDEINLSIPKGDTELVQKIDANYNDFKSPAALIKFRVPIRSSVGVGPNWWEAGK